MKKIILYVAILEISYLSLSFALAEIYGQWNIVGEVIRTGLRVISIIFYGYFYQKYFYNPSQIFKTKELLSPQFIAAILLFLLFAVVYTNAENETIFWQFIFVISGVTAGLREELFYRGIVQNFLERKYGYKIGLAVATLVFTLSHVQYIYYGQTGGLILITMAGIIFGSIFIYTKSIVFTAAVHGLYDALLSVNIVPFRLSNNVVVPILFLIMLAFLIIINKKLYSAQKTDNTDGGNQDNLSLG
jgi:membrane protease YdiL (CAAX protease family)